MSEQQWTPERHRWARELADRKDGDVQILLGYALDHIESQRLELEAARKVVGRTRTMLSTLTIADENDIFNKHRVKKTIEAYDAVRNQRATSEEDDSDE